MIGVDEVGRGALFGPVTVGAVLVTRARWMEISEAPWLSTVNDSKLLRERKRDELAPLITQSFPSAVSHTAVRYIDTYNISRAVQRGIYKAVQNVLAQSQISPADTYVLFDGKYLPIYPQVNMVKPMPRLEVEVKADQKYFPVSAASIIAKVARDGMVARAAARFPGYVLEQHAGYGTALHRDAIGRLGATKFHRQSFKLC